MNFATFAAIAAVAVGWVLYKRHEQSETEIRELQRTRAAHVERAEGAEAKLAETLKRLAAAEAQERANSGNPKGPTLRELREQTDKLRADWKVTHWKFQQRLEQARSSMVGREVAEVKTTTGKSWPKAKIAAVAPEGIRIEHAEGVTRISAAELTGALADHLLLGWKANLPAELDAPGTADDVPLPPLPASAPLATLTPVEREARAALVRVRIVELDGRVARAKVEMDKEKDAQRHNESRVEAAQLTQQTAPRGAHALAEASRKRAEVLQTRIIAEEREILGLKRELKQIDALAIPVLR